MGPKEIIKIVFTEKDLKELIAKEYNIDVDTCSLIINKYDGDAREPSYTSIIFEGTKKQNIENFFPNNWSEK